MTRTLTTPIAQPNLATATLDQWGVQIVRNPDNTVNLPQSQMFAVITLRNGSTPATQRRLAVTFDNLPAPLANNGRNLHNAILTALENAAVLPPGTDVADF